MADLHSSVLLHEYTQRLIRIKARQMTIRPGFSRSDYDDLEQELACFLLQRVGRFDPGRASLETFVSRVVDSAVATILRDRNRIKRGAGQAPASLDTPVTQADGAAASPRDLLTEADSRRRTGTSPDEPVTVRDRAEAVERAVRGLPRDLREICRRLTCGAPASVARDLDMSRRQVRKAIEEIRRHFDDAGLGDL